MVVKIYVSTISGNMEIKKQQEFLSRLLTSKKIEFEEIDISDGTKEEEKLFMRENSKPKDGQKVPLPPQIFHDAEYCGDYDALHEANEDDELYEFLKLAPAKQRSQASVNITEVNRNVLKDQTNDQMDVSAGNEFFVTKGSIFVTNSCKNSEQHETIVCSSAPVVHCSQIHAYKSMSENNENQSEMVVKTETHLEEGNKNSEEENNNDDDEESDKKRENADEKKKKSHKKKSKKDKSRQESDSGSSSSSSESEEDTKKEDDDGGDDDDSKERKSDDDNEVEPPPLEKKFNNRKEDRKSREVHEYENVILTPDGEKQIDIEGVEEMKDEEDGENKQEENEVDVEFEPSDFVADECLQDLIDVNAELQAAKAAAKGEDDKLAQDHED